MWISPKKITHLGILTVRSRIEETIEHLVSANGLVGGKPQQLRVPLKKRNSALLNQDAKLGNENEGLVFFF